MCLEESHQFCETCVPAYCTPYCQSKKIPTGTLYLNCERLKHNGLQDDCKRPKCEKNEYCFAGQKTFGDRNMVNMEDDVKHNGLQGKFRKGKYKIKQEPKQLKEFQ